MRQRVSYAGNRVTLYASRDFDWRGGTGFFPLQHELLPAYALLMLIGVMGGFFVVPLNALLQERVKKASGRGMRLQYKTLAKTAPVLMLGIYSLAVMIGIPGRAHWHWLRCAFALAITALWIWQRRH
ncbi:major facilitator superfamily protein [Escherichia coli]|uniref:Major facilitator superfamily protein n=1 Tax=Escherichia coli TaxID=562 RepID=A0A376Y3Y0_ECOLX|nr:major facilitator superfamily protein [Escherichia coli]